MRRKKLQGGAGLLSADATALLFLSEVWQARSERTFAHADPGCTIGLPDRNSNLVDLDESHAIMILVPPISSHLFS